MIDHLLVTCCLPGMRVPPSFTPTYFPVKTCCPKVPALFDPKTNQPGFAGQHNLSNLQGYDLLCDPLTELFL